MRVGSAEVDAVRLGGQEVSKIMLGSQEVWSSVPEPVDDIFGDGSAVYLWRFNDNVTDNIAGKALGLYDGTYGFVNALKGRALDCPILRPCTMFLNIIESPLSLPATVSFWLQMTGTIPSNFASVNLHTWWGSTFYQLFIVRYVQASNVFNIYVYGTNSHIQYEVSNAGGNIPVHIAISLTSAGVKLYVNGGLVATGDGARSPDIIWGHIMQTGFNTQSSPRLYQDTLRFFNREITDAEALILYEEQF